MRNPEIAMNKLEKLEGKLKTRDYEDADKKKRYITEVITQNIRLLSESKKKDIDKEIPF